MRSATIRDRRTSDSGSPSTWGLGCCPLVLGECVQGRTGAGLDRGLLRELLAARIERTRRGMS